MSEEYDKEPRVLPQSALDFSLMTTDTLYGTQYVSPKYRSFFKVVKQKVDENGNNVFDKDGKPVVYEVDLHSGLALFTRDIRLGNIVNSRFNRELDEVRHFLNLSVDLVQEGLPESGITSIGRVATVIESSHSKSGWFREETNKVRHESTLREEGPKKKQILSRGED